MSARAKNTPSQSYLLECLTYDSETGNLYWRDRPIHHFVTHRSWLRFNNTMPGKIAGMKATQYSSGAPRSIAVKINDYLYGAHRLIWTIVHGQIDPNMLIDHINGDPWDNRLCNLRLATASENNQNRRIAVSNTSGLKGVHFVKRTGRYSSAIAINGVQISLGYFDTAEEAYSAYCVAAKQHHGEFARLQ